MHAFITYFENFKKTNERDHYVECTSKRRFAKSSILLDFKVHQKYDSIDFNSMTKFLCESVQKVQRKL